MFSHELDRVRYPLPARGRGILLGSLLTIGVVAAMVSARTVPFLYGVAVGAFLIAAMARGEIRQAMPERGSVAWHLGLFVLYALASAAWAYAPATAFISAALTVVIAAGTLALIALLDKETRPNLLHMGEGVWIGLIVGLAYLVIELVSGQSIKLVVYNALGFRPDDLPHSEYYAWTGAKLSSISPEDLTRNMVPVALFLWPAVMAAMGTLRRRSGVIVACLAVLLAGAVIMLSRHETSKLAYIAGLVAFAAASLSTRLTGRVVATGWVIACLAVLPTALIVHRLDLHNASWLPFTAQHRIIIWNHTAEQVLKAPLLGVGARTTYVLGPQLSAGEQAHPDEIFQRTLSVHSHSVYLQTWYELGLIGATLLTLLGLAILQAIGSLARPLQPFAYAAFVSAAVMAASSYGMWQAWFIATFGLAGALVALGARLMIGRGDEAAVARAPKAEAIARV